MNKTEWIHGKIIHVVFHHNYLKLSKNDYNIYIIVPEEYVR